MSFGIRLISRYLELLRVAAAGSSVGTLMPAVAGTSTGPLRSPYNGRATRAHRPTPPVTRPDATPSVEAIAALCHATADADDRSGVDAGVWSKMKTRLSRGGVMIETQLPAESDSSFHRAKRWN
jgi:hypothetical protein